MESNFKKFLVLWFGQLVAAVSHGMSAFALGVVAFELSGKTMDSSLVMLLGFMPSVILSIPAGVLADKYDRRLLMILGDGLSAIGILLVYLFSINGKIELVHILIGVTISSIFSSLMQPAFQATVSDLLDEEQYTKSSGLIQIANASRFIISPILAGIMLKSFGLNIILLIDIFTVFLTVGATFYIKNSIKTQKVTSTKSFKEEVSDGWNLLKTNKGLLNLITIATALTFFMGFMQNLASPYFLTFSNSVVLGRTLTISSLGMLVGGIFLSNKKISKNFVDILCISLGLCGIFMAGFGASLEILIITISGFLFFLCLPFANTMLDYLVRTNTKKEHQGKIWSFIGFISQMGYVISYPLSGYLADKIFIKSMSEGGIFSKSIGKILGVGAARGIGLEIIIAGICLVITAIFLSKNKNVRLLEKGKVKNELEASV